MKYFVLKTNKIMATGIKKVEFGQNIIKKTKKVNYADKAAWLVVDAINNAMEKIDDEIILDKENVGVITISNICTLETMKIVSQSAKEGRVSPLKFAAANPGSLTGLACISFGFMGPSLTFIMPPEKGLFIAAFIARTWFKEYGIKYVIINTYSTKRNKYCVARSIIISQGEIEDRMSEGSSCLFTEKN